MVGHNNIRRGGDCGMRERCVGANDDDVHDDVQFAGGDLPSRVFRPVGAPSRFDNATATGGAGAQCQSRVEHNVHHEL
jgi:hypothetical protein